MKINLNIYFFVFVLCEIVVSCSSNKDFSKVDHEKENKSQPTWTHSPKNIFKKPQKNDIYFEDSFDQKLDYDDFYFRILDFQENQLKVQVRNFYKQGRIVFSLEFFCYHTTTQDNFISKNQNHLSFQIPAQSTQEYFLNLKNDLIVSQHCVGNISLNSHLFYEDENYSSFQDSEIFGYKVENKNIVFNDVVYPWVLVKTIP